MKTSSSQAFYGSPRAAALAAALAGALLCGGCGQRANLVLPDQASAKPPRSSAPATAAPAASASQP